MTTSPRGPDARPLKVRVKTSRGRTTSQQKWLQRQLNDPYVARAKREGWRSRAAFKLIEMDEKLHLFRRGMRVVDLGAAPGGWSQVAAERVQSVGGTGKGIAIDISPMEALPGVTVLHLDFLAEGAEDRLKELLPDGKADVVLSDMAAPTIGWNADRSPIWPEGVVGCITHTRDYCAAVVARTDGPHALRGIGVDIETPGRITDAIALKTFTEEERAALASVPEELRQGRM